MYCVIEADNWNKGPRDIFRRADLTMHALSFKEIGCHQDDKI